MDAAPIQAQFVELMSKVALALDEIFNDDGKKSIGFILMVFPFDEVRGEGRANYISNANPDDVVTMLKEQIARFEGQPEMKGHA